MKNEKKNITVKINISNQKLIVFKKNEQIFSFPISSSKNGAGQALGSGCTPLGEHKIKVKIGDGEPINRVFVGRRPLDLIYTKDLAERFPERDWILTRILWLTGLESGFNRGGKQDSLRRFIYIHGTPDEEIIGKPGSHGCIRMRNKDLLILFQIVENGTSVLITA